MIPKNAARLIDAAEANGWAVDARHGQSEDGTVQSFGVRLTDGRKRAFGTWSQGRWFSGRVRHTELLATESVGYRHTQSVGYRELLDLVQSG